MSLFLILSVIKEEIHINSFTLSFRCLSFCHALIDGGLYPPLPKTSVELPYLMQYNRKEKHFLLSQAC